MGFNFVLDLVFGVYADEGAGAGAEVLCWSYHC